MNRHIKPTGPQGPSGEEQLYEHTRRIAKRIDGEGAVHFRFSSLLTIHRRPENLAIAAECCLDALGSPECHWFPLANGDLVVIATRETTGALETAITQVRNLFTEDPIGPEAFSRTFMLDHEFAEFFDIVGSLLREDTARKAEGGPGGAPALEPLTPARLGQVEGAVANFDLSDVVRRQAVCALTPGAPPRPVFNETYFSIDELRRRLLPDVDLLANRWLFQYLTCILDERLLKLLGELESKVRLPTSININISTLTSRAFLDFDRRRARAMAREKDEAKRAKRLILELQPFDVIADMPAFNFARNFARARNYMICLDGLSCLNLPLLPRDLLNVDLAKLHWRAEESDAINQNRSAVAETVERFGASRVILARCDDAQAIELGQSVGITLFQGRHVDKLLARKP